MVSSPKRLLSYFSYYALKRYFLKYPKEKLELLNSISFEEKSRLVNEEDFLKYVLDGDEKIKFLVDYSRLFLEHCQRRGQCITDPTNIFADNIYSSLTTKELNELG